MTTEATTSRFLGRVLAILCGPIGGALVALALSNTSLADPARLTAGLATWMVLWWVLEVVPLAITSLLPVAVLPLTGVMTLKEAAAPFAHEIIFLFLGGFMLGLSLERWNAHKRIALGIVRIVGCGPKQVVAGFMIASALLSMFISNTATVIMLLPIAVSVIALMQNGEAEPTDHKNARNFAIALLLGVAYASSVGGVATINGSPPNGILVAFLDAELDTKVDYAQWMKFGLPLASIMLPCVWWLLVFVLFPIHAKADPTVARHFQELVHGLGPVSRGEWTVLCVFGSTALTWIFKEPIAGLFGVHDGMLLTDTGIALLGAMALFVIPIDLQKGVFALDWNTAKTLPWGILLLFGGGLSLAAAVQASGLDVAIGSQVGSMVHPPPLVTLLIVALGIVFLTEVMSNTAVTSAFLPVLGAASVSLGVSPFAVCIVAGTAASFAFMLPVATPPNAIVFGSGRIRTGQMARAGLLLNLLGSVLIVTLMAVVGTRVFDVSLTASP